VVVRKALLERIDGLCEDKRLIAIEDYDAWLRIAKISDKFTRIPVTLGYYWRGGGNISQPKQLLDNYCALEDRYADAYRDFSGSDWLAYAKGRAHYMLGSYASAKAHLREVRWRRASLSLYLKSQWMLFKIDRAGRSRT
jgi:hypothetical protein